MTIKMSLKAAMTAFVAGAALWSCSGDDGEHARYVAVQIDGEEKWSILDTESGEILCKNDFNNMPSAINEDGWFVVMNKDGEYEAYSVKDSKKALNKGKYSQLGCFTDKVTFAVKKGKAITIIDKDFEVVKTLSDKITVTCSFTDGMAGFCKDGKWGYLDTKGEEAIAAKYDWVAPFAEGLALVTKGERTMIINKKGETVKSFPNDKYEFGSPVFTNGYIAVRKGEKIVFLDKKGEEAFTSPKMEGYPSYYAIYDGKTVYYDGSQYGLMSKDGEIIVRAKYDGLRYAAPDRYIAKKDDGSYGVIDGKGETVIDFDFDNIGQSSTSADHYFTLSGDKWSLIGEDGKDVCKEAFTAFGASGWHNMYTAFYSEVEAEPEPDEFFDEMAAVDTAAVEEPVVDSIAYEEYY